MSCHVGAAPAHGVVAADKHRHAIAEVAHTAKRLVGEAAPKGDCHKEGHWEAHKQVSPDTTGVGADEPDVHLPIHVAPGGGETSHPDVQNAPHARCSRGCGLTPRGWASLFDTDRGDV